MGDDRVAVLERAALEMLPIDPRSAAGLLMRAVGLAAPGERARLHGLHVKAWAWASSPTAAVDAGIAALAETLPDDVRCDVAIHVSASLRLLERAGESAALLARWRPPRDVGAASLSRWAAEESFVAMTNGDLAGAVEAAERALAVADDGDRRARAVAYAARSQIELLQMRSTAASAFAAAARDHLDIDVGDRDDGQPVRGIIATALGVTGAMADAASLLEEAVDEARRTQCTWFLPNHLANLGNMRFHLGEWDAAVRAHDEAVAAAAEARRPLARAMGYAVAAYVAAARGDDDAVRRSLAAGRADGADPRLLDWAAARHADASGAADRACTLAASAAQCGPIDLTVVGADVVRLAAPEVAAGVVDALAAIAMHAGVPVLTAVHDWAAGNLTHEPARILGAIEGGELPATSRWQACVDAATLLIERGDLEPAVAPLLDAERGYESVGADAALRRVRALLRAAGHHRGPRGARTPDDLGLTRTERVVLEHVRDGLTNAAIATRLHISKRTVETHVANLLRKTGARNRLEVVARAQSTRH